MSASLHASDHFSAAPRHPSNQPSLPGRIFDGFDLFMEILAWVFFIGLAITFIVIGIYFAVR